MKKLSFQRLPGLPDLTNHKAPDSVVERQFLAFFYGCFENQEKRTDSLLLWIGFESGHAQCELVVNRFCPVLRVGVFGKVAQSCFLVQGHNFYSPVSLKRIIEEIMFMAILEVLWHYESHLYFQTSLFYNPRGRFRRIFPAWCS